MTNAAMVWMLITVTYGGDVGHSRGYESRHLCEEAASIALTGMTIEANATADAAYEKLTTDGCGMPVAVSPNLTAIGAWCGVASPPFNPNEGEAMEFVRGHFVHKHRRDVKVAECVPDPGP